MLVQIKTDASGTCTLHVENPVDGYGVCLLSTMYSSDYFIISHPNRFCAETVITVLQKKMFIYFSQEYITYPTTVNAMVGGYQAVFEVYERPSHVRPEIHYKQDLNSQRLH